MRGPGELIDIHYNLIRRGWSGIEYRVPKATHDNPLRRLGREMRALAQQQVRRADPRLQQDGVRRTPERRERRELQLAMFAVRGLRSGRQWRRLRKRLQRIERAQ